MLLQGQRNLEDALTSPCIRNNRALQMPELCVDMWGMYKAQKGAAYALGKVSSDEPFSGCAIYLRDLVPKDKDVQRIAGAQTPCNTWSNAIYDPCVPTTTPHPWSYRCYQDGPETCELLPNQMPVLLRHCQSDKDCNSFYAPETQGDRIQCVNNGCKLPQP